MLTATIDNFITTQLSRLCDSALGPKWEETAQHIIDFALDEEYLPQHFDRFSLMHYKKTGIIGVFDTTNKSCYVISYTNDYKPELVFKFQGNLSQYLEDMDTSHEWIIEYSADPYRLAGTPLRPH